MAGVALRNSKLICKSFSATQTTYRQVPSAMCCRAVRSRQLLHVVLAQGPAIFGHDATTQSQDTRKTCDCSGI